MRPHPDAVVYIFFRSKRIYGTAIQSISSARSLPAPYTSRHPGRMQRSSSGGQLARTGGGRGGRGVAGCSGQYCNVYQHRFRAISVVLLPGTTTVENLRSSTEISYARISAKS
jgi:hypothetical protein